MSIVVRHWAAWISSSALSNWFQSQAWVVPTSQSLHILGAALTGSMLFMSKVHVYFYNLQFQLKFLCMFLAGLNMAVFHLDAYRHVRDWDRQPPPPPPPPRVARLAGALSIMLWIGVVFLGRWIGFTT